MNLTPKELDRLTVFTLAELARKRRARGLQLNHPESVAIICDEIFEEARAGRPYAEVVAHGMSVLRRADVLPGVTINLKAEGTSTLTVDDDTDAIVDRVKAVVAAYNDVRTFVDANADVSRTSTLMSSSFPGSSP